MTKIFPLGAVAILCLLISATVAAEEKPGVFIDPASIECPRVDGTFSITVNIEDAEEVGSDPAGVGKINWNTVSHKNAYVGCGFSSSEKTVPPPLSDNNFGGLIQSDNCSACWVGVVPEDEPKPRSWVPDNRGTQPRVLELSAIPQITITSPQPETSDPRPFLEVTLTDAEHAWYNLEGELIDYIICSSEPECSQGNIKTRLAGENQPDYGTDYTRLLMHLDEGSGTTASDSSVYGNDGVITEPGWVDGMFQNALEFDDSVLVIEKSDNLDTPIMLTFEAWIYLDKVERMENSIILQTFPTYEFGVDVDNKLFARIHDWDSPGAMGWEELVGSTQIKAGEWTHVAITYDLFDRFFRLYS